MSTLAWVVCHGTHAEGRGVKGRGTTRMGKKGLPTFWMQIEANRNVFYGDFIFWLDFRLGRPFAAFYFSALSFRAPTPWPPSPLPLLSLSVCGIV